MLSRGYVDDGVGSVMCCFDHLFVAFINRFGTVSDC